MRKLYVILSAAFLAGSAGIWTLLGPADTASGSATTQSSADSAVSPAGARSHKAPPRATTAMQRYKLTYEHHVRFGDDQADPTTLTGVWTTAPLGNDRIEVRLSDVVLGGDPSLPKPEQIASPFQMGLTDGRLSTLGFVGGTPEAAQELLSTLASVLAFTPGEGSAWSVDEEDRIGQYRAEYKRTGNEVVRTRTLYTAVRSAQGTLAEKGADRLSAAGAAHFELDTDGDVVRAAIDERFSMTISKEFPAIVVAVKATLTRLDKREVPSRSGELLALAPLRGFKADPNHARNQDLKVLGDADTATLLKEARALAGLPKRDKAAVELKLRTYKRLRALLRLQPDEAETLEAAYLEQSKAGEEIPQVLTSALAQADTPEATEALVRLLGTEELPANAKKDVAMSLALVDDPTEESTDALLSALDDSAAGSEAAMALGVQANKLMETDPEAAEAIVDELVKRYTSAPSYGKKLTYLDALGNSGHPKAFPFLEEATHSQDPRLEKIGTYGMRFVPGGDADKVLDLQLASGSKAMQLAAIHAIGFRSADTWRDRLAALRAGMASDVQGAIDRVLRMWT